MDRAALTVIDGEALIADSHIQQALGYGRINDLHRIIRKHEAELADYGEILCRSGKVSGPGRPAITYFLNEAQATLLCMFSRTDRAAAARKLIVEVFTAWRRGQLPAPPAQSADPFAVNAARMSHVAEHLSGLADVGDMVMRVTHLPIWKNGRRPSWWHDVEVRAFLTAGHRQMSTLEAERQGLARFGARCPKKSAICVYWQRLDTAFGPVALPRPEPTKGAA